ncbi:N-acetylmuramoyl-L-alanine amidase [Pseudonocardia sp. RS11V-5]|uniref:peptidoglycan recognition protein family protein n=1 Tax=Pseudonocardia terrae TaxID=2905831 RepID=UPI001E3EB4F2|nr:peptidoglycan-binding domain-containing protein [Pseudonocardia terrae]MCE3555192.1 N-acetylmuramoyl-L-alanine amidase [Pseudonocardia terrae]
MVRGDLTRRGFVLGGLAAGAFVAAPGLARAGEMPAGGPLTDGVASPDIVDCAGWGARPNSAIVPIWNQRPVKILVHHTASANVADTSRGAADRVARAIQNFHMDSRGWLDTGQHFTISRGGFVLEGRHRSLEVLRIGQRQVEGAHCTGQNVVAIGIENEGTYIDQEPPGALWDSLRALCAYACNQYGIAPTELYGHRDFKNTICPGDQLYGMLPRLRSEVAEVLGRGVEEADTQKASWPLLRAGDTGDVVLAAQYLLRDAGLRTNVDGRYTPATTAAVTEFQQTTGAEEPNGILGGESWPVLARTVDRTGEPGSDAARAVEVLASGRARNTRGGPSGRTRSVGSGPSGGTAEAVPDVVDRPAWQDLLGTSGAPANTAVDPSGPPR